MSLTPGSFRPGELAGADAAPSDTDLAAAYAAAREIEAALPAERVAPSAGFADRVMAAVALEPAPRRAGFIAVLRAHPGPAGLAASVREAWAVFAGGPGRPAAARGMALAYVLAVAVIGTSLTGVAAYGAAGALGLLDDGASPSPSVVSPTVEPTPSGEPTRLPEPSPSTEPTEPPSPAPTAGESPEPSDTPSVTRRPSATARPTPTSTPSDEGASPSPSPDDDNSPEPSSTPRPSDSPNPSETPG